MRTKVAAILVVCALGGLAGYTLFSGPTTVPAKGPVQVTTTQTVPAPAGEEPEGAESGD